MRTQGWPGRLGWWSVELMVVLVMLLAGMVMISALTGCSRFKQPAGVPSDQKTPIVMTPETMRVLLAGVDKDAQVLASALEATPEAGSVIYEDHNGYVYGPDGKIQTDPKTGEALRTRTKIVAKLHSLSSFQEMTGVDTVDYEVGGRSFLELLPGPLQAMDTCPVPLRLRIKGLSAAKVTSHVAEDRSAAGKERDAIFTGMSALATAQGAAWAVRAKAVADGVQVVTAAGLEFAGKVLTAKAVAPDAALTAAGVGKIIAAVLRTPEGGLKDVVAEGAAATVLEAAAK